MEPVRGPLLEDVSIQGLTLVGDIARGPCLRRVCGRALQSGAVYERGPLLSRLRRASDQNEQDVSGVSLPDDGTGFGSAASKHGVERVGEDCRSLPPL